MSEEATCAGKTAAAVFAADLSGNSVLDANCGAGDLCIEAWKRGARPVVGFDADPDRIARARARARKQRADISFELRDLERRPVDRTFDYVLCLDLLDEVRDPFTLLDHLTEACRRRLAIDVATINDNRFGGLARLPMLQRLASNLSFAAALPAATAGKRQLPKFLISPSAMRRMLTDHRRFFSRVAQLSRADASRQLFVADKFQIDRLITVAGPVSAGKSTLCRNLLEGRLPRLYERLNVGPRERPTSVYLPRARGSTPPDGGTVLFHYNFLNPHVSSARIPSRDENLDILEVAARRSFVTIWASPERLVQQITQSEIERGPFRRPTRRHLMLREEYRDPRKVVSHYDTWIDFVESFAGHHVIAEQDGSSMRFLTVAEWRSLTAPHRSTPA